MDTHVQPEVTSGTKKFVSFLRIKLAAVLCMSMKIGVRKQNFVIGEIVQLISDSTKLWYSKSDDIFRWTRELLVMLFSYFNSNNSSA